MLSVLNNHFSHKREHNQSPALGAYVSLKANLDMFNMSVLTIKRKKTKI